MPFKYIERTKQMKTLGNFCSWGCMKAYNFDKNGDIKSGAINSLINKLHSDSTGKWVNIKKAPDRYILESFGGTYSIEEFRNIKDGGRPIINYPNQIFLIQNVIKPSDISFKDPTSTELENKLKNINNAPASSNNSLKLKRTKPLKREINNLELSMGIKRITKQI
jgi:hypothetical protein